MRSLVSGVLSNSVAYFGFCRAVVSVLNNVTERGDQNCGKNSDNCYYDNKFYERKTFFKFLFNFSNFLIIFFMNKSYS